ncbi:asparaginase [Natrinema versiforme]|uniref:L-asparaginase n=1 Tax=Natrinema versiforme TaxID=88724 RepID=A0A4P8WPC1_9EURY|nr:asparaginase [Natrinema versiforme]QCS43951.1 asparaginase [Natrinema versiforme]
MNSNVHILSTGGTIASTGKDDGAKPDKQGSELLADIPEIDDYASVSVEQVAQIPSFTMDFETMVTIVRRAEAAISAGADAIVVTHGTDTLEESAFFADQTLGGDTPIVFTGAQRRPDEISPDGPANIVTAVRAADHDAVQAAGGSYVAFDEQLHEARSVTKAHTSRLDTFRSPDSGPVASLDHGGFRFHYSPPEANALFDPVVPDAAVRIVPSYADCPRDPVDEAVDAGVDGLVIEGTGLGNTTAALSDAIADALDAGVPVVVASRCLGGATAPVYGNPGGGETLRQQGVGFAGDLSAQKARIKLALALTATADPLEQFPAE